MNRMEAEWAAMTDEEIEQRTRMISHEISVRTTPTPRGFGAGGEGSEGRSRGPMGAVSRVRAGLAHSLLRPPCRNSTVSTAAWCTTSTPRPKTSRTTRCFSPPLFFCCRTPPQLDRVPTPADCVAILPIPGQDQAQQAAPIPGRQHCRGAKRVFFASSRRRRAATSGA